MCAQCIECYGVRQLLVLELGSEKLPGHRLEVALDVLLEARRLGGVPALASLSCCGVYSRLFAGASSGAISGAISRAISQKLI